MKHLRDGGTHDYMHPVDEGYRPRHKALPPQHRRDVVADTAPLWVSTHHPYEPTHRKPGAARS